MLRALPRNSDASGTVSISGPFSNLCIYSVGHWWELDQLDAVYSIPCDWGRCYIRETSRPLEVRIKEHKYNLTKGLLEKSKLAQVHKICWNEAKVLQIEANTTCRKYKEYAHMSLIDHHPSLDISPIWTPVITAEVKKYNAVKCSFSGKICFSCVGTIRSTASLQWWFLSWYFSGARLHTRSF
jgi:hypothetical protein